jgi:hypothetical protein
MAASNKRVIGCCKHDENASYRQQNNDFGRALAQARRIK